MSTFLNSRKFPAVIHHLAFRCEDPEAIARFYERVFGFPRLRETNGNVWLDAGGGAILMIEKRDTSEPKVAAGTREFVAFTIAENERDAFRARLVVAGVEIEAESEFTIYFRDPEGRRVGGSHFPEPPRAVPLRA